MYDGKQKIFTICIRVSLYIMIGAVSNFVIGEFATTFSC
jgi:hypothetical protein